MRLEALAWVLELGMETGLAGWEWVLAQMSVMASALSSDTKHRYNYLCNVSHFHRTNLPDKKRLWNRTLHNNMAHSQ